MIGELDKAALYQNHISTSDALVTTDQLNFSPIVFHISERDGNVVEKQWTVERNILHRMGRQQVSREVKRSTADNIAITTIVGRAQVIWKLVATNLETVTGK